METSKSFIQSAINRNLMVEWEEDQKFGHEKLLWDAQMPNCIERTSDTQQFVQMLALSLSPVISACSDVLRLCQ